MLFTGQSYLSKNELQESEHISFPSVIFQWQEMFDFFAGLLSNILYWNSKLEKKKVNLKQTNENLTDINIES